MTLSATSIFHHAYNKKFPHIGIEFRQDLINTKEKATHWAQILAEAFDKIFKEDTLYQIGDYQP